MRKTLLVLAPIFIVIIIGFLLINEEKEIKIEDNRNQNLYKILQEHFPYTIKKIDEDNSEIVFKDGREIEESSNSQLFHIIDQIEKDWADKYLILDGTVLVILDDYKQEKRRIQLNEEETNWIKEYFGI
ncbi:hypothetical protein [Aliarcobacter thereius]|uniref:Uncharacterized protein n=2 Tax=Aliarcobacter thereius TaxID=544718 RepID=A0A5R9GW70_9BACT|nr:hypothetical protein [Aliarcobacter thereius]OCL92306.1 hypothetical protein AAX25_01044 [Aliarcobacter thereius]OCL94599.1 hypothetical protein AA347_00028 [Aliarcobacter thereius LMG 24486]QBF15524.1 hypothetical protein ATH_0443 [Aliarcobacter thereius LMG 24486]TLS70840.1 hypothetical protein FE246_09555 [Aliarcobacter thereius]TLS91748.1 hypothetical protein FE244_08195 [Aliarcobacter thereius]